MMEIMVALIILSDVQKLNPTTLWRNYWANNPKIKYLNLKGYLDEKDEWHAYAPSMLWTKIILIRK